MTITSIMGEQASRPNRQRVYAKIIRYVSERPGRTVMELARRYCPTDPRHIGRHMAKLERLGRIKRGEIRPCRITGRKAYTWLPGDNT